MSIATKLQTVYDGVEDIRDAIQEADITLGRGTVDTLGDDIRSLTSGGTGYGFQVYGDVRTEEEVEVEDPETHETTTETEYVYTRSLILDSTLAAMGDDLNTAVIDVIGELSGPMVSLANNKVQIPLNTGVVITVDATKCYVKFRDPIVESIILSHWGTDGKITLATVRSITNFENYFQNQAIETFNEFKWFDGYVGGNGGNNTKSYPFNGCSSLTEIKLPRVDSIGSGPFSTCSSLAHLEIPNTITKFGNGYSYQTGYIKNTAIEEFVIPDSVVETQPECFYGASSLKRLVWGDNLPFPNKSGIEQSFRGCSNLEVIENLPSTSFTSVPSFRDCSKLDFTNIIGPLIDCMSNTEIRNNSYRFYGTKIFDYHPTGIIVISGITSNPDNTNCRYGFISDSVAGYTLSFPNWTVNPNGMGDNKVGKVIFSENTTSLGTFGTDNPYCAAYILPCSTPPTLSTTSIGISGNSRIYVPASSLASYQAAENWSEIARVRAFNDPANAQFCSIPDAAPVPSDYTKVHYISNIDGDGIKNSKISNLGYMPKQYCQILLDFEHKFVRAVSDYESSCSIFNTGDSNIDYRINIASANQNESIPLLYRKTSSNANYPNRMGINLSQQWAFNPKITGETFGQRSTLKISHSFLEYHGLAWQKDEETGDSPSNLGILNFNNSENIGRQVKIYRMCMFEPVANASDYDDPSEYEIVRDYIPVMRNSDGKFGLYERLTNTFYTSTIAAAPFSGPAYE